MAILEPPNVYSTVTFLRACVFASIFIIWQYGPEHDLAEIFKRLNFHALTPSNCFNLSPIKKKEREKKDPPKKKEILRVSSHFCFLTNKGFNT